MAHSLPQGTTPIQQQVQRQEVFIIKFNGTQFEFKLKMC